MKFKVGDRVKVIRETSNEEIKIGFVGTVNEVYKIGLDVEFDNYINGHSNIGKGKSGHCWDLHEKDLKLLSRVEISGVLYGTKTTIIKWSDGTQTQAICSKNDEFDKQVGFAIAYTRKMNGGKLHE